MERLKVQALVKKKRKSRSSLKTAYTNLIVEKNFTDSYENVQMSKRCVIWLFAGFMNCVNKSTKRCRRDPLYYSKDKNTIVKKAKNLHFYSPIRLLHVSHAKEWLKTLLRPKKKQISLQKLGNICLPKQKKLSMAPYLKNGRRCRNQIIYKKTN